MRFIVPVKRDTHNWEIAMSLMETVKQRYLMEQGKKWKGVETKISYGDFSEGRDIRLSDGYFYCPESPDISKMYAGRSN